MFRSGSIQSHLSLRDKIFSLDPLLTGSIFLIGIISFFAMYSTDGGQFAYHTKSHIIRFFIFFFLFFAVSKINLLATILSFLTPLQIGLYRNQ